MNVDQYLLLPKFIGWAAIVNILEYSFKVLDIFIWFELVLTSVEGFAVRIGKDEVERVSVF